MFVRIDPEWRWTSASLSTPRPHFSRAGAKDWLPKIDAPIFARLCRSVKCAGFKDDSDPTSWPNMSGTEALRRFENARRLGGHPTIILDNIEGGYIPTLHVLRWIEVPWIWSRNPSVFMTWSAAGGGVGVHYDDDDNIVVQLQGRRRWRVSRERVLPSYPDRAGGYQLNPENCDEYVLEPADVLYLPRGYWHEGVSLDESISVTFGWDGAAMSAYLGGVLDCLIQIRKERSPEAARNLVGLLAQADARFAAACASHTASACEAFFDSRVPPHVSVV